MRDWELPSELSAGNHHEPRQNEWSLAELIKMSCRLADVVGLTAFPGCFIEEYSNLINELPQACRRDFPREIDSLRKDLTARLQSLEAG